jgi:hypothetical protein
MKLIGPIVLLMVLVLAASIIWYKPAVWSIGAIVILAVVVSIVWTLLADMRAAKRAEDK